MREKLKSLIPHELPKESSDEYNFPLRTQLSGLEKVYRQQNQNSS